MKMTIERKSNGVHSYIMISGKDIKEKEDLEVMDMLLDVINKYNDMQVKNA